MTIKNLQQKVSIFVSDLAERRKECEELGDHINVIWFPYAATNRRSIWDGARGMCNYCFAEVTRPLNKLELKKVYSLRRSF